MVGAYKTLKKTDIQAIPYEANKPWTIYSSSYASLGIKFWVGRNVTGSFIKATDPITTDLGSSETNYKRLIYSSVKQLYYSNYLSASYQIKTGSYDNFEQSTLVYLVPSSSYQQYHNPPTKYFPTASDSEIRVISIPRKIFGSKIVPGTFSILSNNNFDILDDKEGNLFNFPSSIQSQSITGSSGSTNIIYTFVDLGSTYFIGGDFTSWNNTSSYNGAFVNTNFTKTSLLVSFSAGVTSNFVRESVVDSNGKLYAVGDFTKYNTSSSIGIIRLDSSGAIDTSFNVGGGFNSASYSIITSSISSSLYAVGEFTTYSGSSCGQIVKLNLNGTRDSTFQTSSFTGSGGFFAYRVIESGSKLYITGQFTTRSNAALNNRYILRLNQGDGTLDSSFDVGTGFSNNTYGISISGSKVYVGGQFTSYNGTSSNYIIALNQDASVDTSFNIGTGFNVGSSVYTTNVIDGKIYVGGNFTSYNGTSSNRIIRLNGNGTVDTSFNVGTGFSGSSPIVYSIKDSGSQIIALGKFESYSGSSCMQGLAVINKADGTLVSPIAVTSTSASQVLVGNILYPHGTAIITNPSYINFIDTSSINDFTMSFKGEHIIHEHQVTCHSTEEDFNYTLNPSALGITGSLSDLATGSYFNPYITTVGLYNENKELLAVGKINKPTPIPRNSDITFILRWDS